MDYKKVLPNQETRFKILNLMDFIPDKLMIKMQYKIKTGRKLNLKNPKRFTEKLQWYKLYYRDPLMTRCADKYKVREFVDSEGFSDILIPLYGVYDKADEIDFEKLPNKFVFKTNNGSHTNIICEDKSKLNIEEAKKQLDAWLKRTSKAGREWPYFDIEPKIICEEFLEKDKNNDLVDYKFMCFNGEIDHVYVNTETSSNKGIKTGIFNSDLKIQPYHRAGFRKLNSDYKKPQNYEYMIEIVKKLSRKFPHVRVDLYNVDGKIYFGELTFFAGSGYTKFIPDRYDFILGEKFSRPDKFYS